MKPRMIAYEREEEEIEADFAANLISKQERDKAIKDLWKEYRELKQEAALRYLNEDDWDE